MRCKAIQQIYLGDKFSNQYTKEPSHSSLLKKAVRRSMGVSPMRITGILPVIPTDSRGETPLGLMGKMPMLLTGGTLVLRALLEALDHLPPNGKSREIRRGSQPAM